MASGALRDLDSGGEARCDVRHLFVHVRSWSHSHPQGDPHMTSRQIPQGFERPLARRGLLKGIGAAAAFATVPGALAACSSSKSSKSSGGDAGSATAPV